MSPVIIESRDGKEAWRVNWADLYTSFQVNSQLNASYDLSLTLTYTDQYKEVFNATREKALLHYNGETYVIQTRDVKLDDQGMLTLQITAVHSLIDKLKNIRIDPAQPTEASPEVSGGGTSDGTSQDQQPGVVVTPTDQQTTYPLEDRLRQFVDNNDQGIKYELHGSFPQVAVETTGSLYDWLGSNLSSFNAYWIPVGNVIKIYDLGHLRKMTGRQFRYLENMTEAEVQTDVNDLTNVATVYGGKMQKDITSASTNGSVGNLDSAEGFAKSPITADFGVNKQVMLDNFAQRSQRVKAWGVDVNKLYDTIKNAGVSPEWFFAYELMEQGTYYGWLNHTTKNGDAYNDAVSVCAWIKEWANKDQLRPAWSAAEGSLTPNQSLTDKWNREFGKGTIGRLYLQGTAAAVWELAGVTVNPNIGKPLAGCVSVLKGWGGHTIVNNGNSNNTWGWPFPSTGEGSFMQVQKFGYDGGYRTNGFHDGLDFGSIDHPGSEVHAVHGGTVTYKKWGGQDIMWYVVIRDETGLNVEYQEAFASEGNITVSVGQKVVTGQVIGYRNTDHLHIGITRHDFPEAFSHAFSDDGTWLDPQAMIKNGIANAASTSGNNTNNSDDTTLNTTSEVYYALKFEFKDADSVARYGVHRGEPVVVDGIYDINALRGYADTHIQHNPATTLTINGIHVDDFALGDVWRLIAPELNLDLDVTLMGYTYNPYNTSDSNITLTFNNTGLSMKSALNAIWQDIKSINTNIQSPDIYGATGGRQEDHFNNIRYTQDQMNKIIDYTNGKEGTTW